MDESDADDGAIYEFWRYVARQNRPIDLEDVMRFLEALRDFETTR
jgi:hypothetical protein